MQITRLLTITYYHVLLHVTMYYRSSGNHSQKLVQKILNFLTARSMAELLGQRFSTAWAAAAEGSERLA